MDDDITYLGLLEDEAIELDASALQLALLDHPRFDLQPYLSILNAITERLAIVGGSAISAGEQAEALAYVLAGENGFAGDNRTYDDPANADLIRVIDRRRGLPVALSILYVSQARRLGWTADVVNTPGHVLVRVGPETSPLLIDPFAGGSSVDSDQLQTILERALGRGAELSSEHVHPMTNRAVLVRLLMNQAARAERGGDQGRARILYERMTIISPALPYGWWERARLELAADEVAAARASLSAMLEITRDPSLRTHICAALDAIADDPGMRRPGPDAD